MRDSIARYVIKTMTWSGVRYVILMIRMVTRLYETDVHIMICYVHLYVYGTVRGCTRYAKRVWCNMLRYGTVPVKPKKGC